MFCIKFLILLYEIGFYRDLRLREIEWLAPVIPPKHDIHQRLKRYPHLALKLTVRPERRLIRIAIMDSPAVYDRFVLPELWNARSQLDRREDELSSACDHHLGHLVDEHLHQLLDLLVGHSLEIRRKKRQKVIKPLTARKVRLCAPESLYRMENRNLCLLCRTCDTRFRAAAIRHQPVIEEVPEIPVHAETARSEILEIVNVDIPVQVRISEFRGKQEKILLF